MKYDAATTLTSLTQNPAAIKAAAQCFIDLVVRESDNNVKLIVLDRLEVLHTKHQHVLDPLVMDLLRVLQSTDMDVRRKCLGIALGMVTSRNVEEVVGLLKKALTRTTEPEAEKVSLQGRKFQVFHLSPFSPNPNTLACRYLAQPSTANFSSNQFMFVQSGSPRLQLVS